MGSRFPLPPSPPVPARPPTHPPAGSSTADRSFNEADAEIGEAREGRILCTELTRRRASDSFYQAEFVVQVEATKF